MSDTIESGSGLGPLTPVLREKWGWMVALGVALLVLGAIAFGNLFAATFVSVHYIGALMIVGAVAEIILAFWVKSWGGFFFWLLSGLLYGAAGFLAFFNPVLAAGALTLVLAATLLFSGGLRIAAGFRSRPERGWGWVVASGVATFAVGVVVMLGWPANTLWLLGLFLAIDLLSHGATALAFGLTLRKASR